MAFSGPGWAAEREVEHSASPVLIVARVLDTVLGTAKQVGNYLSEVILGTEEEEPPQQAFPMGDPLGLEDEGPTEEGFPMGDPLG